MELTNAGRRKKEQTQTVFDISDLNPIAVIQALFKSASAFGFGLFDPYKDSLTEEEAQSIYNKHCQTRESIDYEYGRPFKISLLNMKAVNVASYNRYHGEGKAQAAFEAARIASTSSFSSEARVKKEMFNDNLLFMKKLQREHPGLEMSDAQAVFLASEQTKLQLPLHNLFRGAFKASQASEKKTTTTEYKLLGKINQLNGQLDESEKTKVDEAIINEAFTPMDSMSIVPPPSTR